jgi:hypothetical protein
LSGETSNMIAKIERLWGPRRWLTAGAPCRKQAQSKWGRELKVQCIEADRHHQGAQDRPGRRVSGAWARKLITLAKADAADILRQAVVVENRR